MKSVKAPKAPKVEKAVKFSSSAQSMKFDKPKKIKEPKAPKAPKPVKDATFKPGKMEKAASYEASVIKKKQVRPAVAVVGILAVIAIVAVAALAAFVPEKSTANATDTKRISIAAMPEKTEYYTDQIASYTGLQVLVTQENGDTYTVEAKHCQIIGFDSSVPVEQQIITVTYDGQSTTFNITIKERPVQERTLKSIEMDTLPKTQYKLGERISIDGGVIRCEYQNGTTAKIDLAKKYVYGVGEVDGPGTYTLTVKYEEGGILCETSYTITVTE